MKLKKTETEKTRGDIIKMSSFCSQCSSVKVEFRSGTVLWQKSIAQFTELPQETCPQCNA